MLNQDLIDPDVLEDIRAYCEGNNKEFPKTSTQAFEYYCAWHGIRPYATMLSEAFVSLTNSEVA